jgi:hypothetical protein
MALNQGDTLPAPGEAAHPALVQVAAGRGARSTVLFLLRAFT